MKKVKENPAAKPNSRPEGRGLGAAPCSQFFVGEDGKPFPMPTGGHWKSDFTAKVLEAVATLTPERQLKVGAYIAANFVHRQKGTK